MKRHLWTTAAMLTGIGGLFAAVSTTPALGAGASGTPLRILSASKGTVAVNDTIAQVLSLRVPAGHWLIGGKLWVSSGSPVSIGNTELGCGLNKGSTVLDNSILNVPKVAGDNSSAGVLVLSAVIKVSGPATITIKCADFDTEVNANNIKLTATGG
jgi:hypothetical protein